MIEEENKILWCGNIAEQVTEEILYELFLQAGPLEKVWIAKDKDGRQKNFAFITYCHEVSVSYAISLFRGTALYHRTLALQCRGRGVLPPPPIRSYGLEAGPDFQNNILQQFSEMTENLNYVEGYKNVNVPHLIEVNDNLVMASLQGNWTHRHHPYRQEKAHSVNDHRSQNNHNDYYNGNSRRKRPNNRRERKNYKNSYYRRD